MDFTFQQTVLISAVILLIIMLVVIGYMMNSVSQAQPWPPSSSNCPDGWDVSGGVCKNTAVDGVFKNSGNWVVDVSCGLQGKTTNLCSDDGLSSSNALTSCPTNDTNNWIQGDDTNLFGLTDVSACYLQAPVGNVKSNNIYGDSTKQYFDSSKYDGASWAQAFGISWDGIN